jgi:hypothetical protein
MDTRGRKFAGVGQKTVEFIESSLGIDDRPHVLIRFSDGTALDIAIESSPNLTAEWLVGKKGDDLKPLQHKIFE